MLLNILLIVGGLILLVGGGEAIVRGSVALASRLGMSKGLIGVTLVGFGTSLPEFVASFGAAAQGSPDIAFGNVIGSNTANILMILGLCALIYPIVTQMRGLARDACFVGLSSAACLLWLYLGGIPTWGALVLLVAFVIYMFLTIRADKAALEGEEISVPAYATAIAIVIALVGIVLLVVGANILIRGASSIATGLGVSEAIIGITIVGVGTSLPEASASIIASLKKENSIAFANIVGSNIFNGLGILGITGLVFPLAFTPGFSIIDGIILCLATFAMFIFAVTHKKVLRWEGTLLFLAYLIYLGWLVMRAIG